MDDETLTRTRHCLHGVAETLLAGPQHRAIGRIRLRVTPGGFSTLDLPGSPTRVAVEGTELGGARRRRCRAAARAGRHVPRARRGGRHRRRGPGGRVPRRLRGRAGRRDHRGHGRCRHVESALATGEHALRRLTAAHGRTGDDAVPVLWPEHFDVGVTLDEVNYGVSPGDSGIAEPYAYVGPWKQRVGDFWDRPYGSARTIRDLGDADAVLAYFETGLVRATQDPTA